VSVELEFYVSEQLDTELVFISTFLCVFHRRMINLLKVY